MNITIRHTQQKGWVEILLNGEPIGKKIRIPKDEFLNEDITIEKRIITGWEIDKEHINFYPVDKSIFKTTIKGDKE